MDSRPKLIVPPLKPDKDWISSFYCMQGYLKNIDLDVPSGQSNIIASGLKFKY